MIDAAHLVMPDWPDCPANVRALATTRAGGVSAGPYDDGRGGGGLNLGLHVGDDPAAVQENRTRLQALLPGRPAWIAQVHGADVVDAASVVPDRTQTGDASIAAAPGVVCAILTADCLPVLFADRGGKVVGAAHAGWRGLAGGVLGQTLAAMRAAGAGEITAWMGPAIGPLAFEVGPDVFDAFGAALPRQDIGFAFKRHPENRNKYLADMFALARLMLERDGVASIAGGTYCTATERDRFYSYRRDGVTGRQASLIWLA